MAKRKWRFIPTKEELKNKKALKFLRPLMNHPEYWLFHHKNLARAVFVGVFTAFIPVPFQMILAVLFSIPLRANIIVAVSLVWISNPLTIPPMLYGCYRLGKLILHIDSGNGAVLHSTIGTSLFTNPGQILEPLLLGCAIAGVVCAAAATLLFYLGWLIVRWRRSRKKVK